jgi:hypothetical protein
VVTVVTVCNLPDARHFLLIELMYLPVCHFGSFIMSLVGALLALRLIEKWQASRAALFTLCVIVADLSNRKFLIDFIVPLGVAGLVLIYLQLLSWRRTAGMVACGIVGLLLARAADHSLVRQPNLPIDEIPMHMHLFFQEVPAYLASIPPATLAIIFIPYVVFAATFVVWLWRRSTSGITLAIAPGDTTVVFLWSFGAVAIVGCVAALSAVYVWPERFRYAEPAYFWPIIFVAAAAMPLLERCIAPLAIGQVAAVSIVIVAIGGWFGFVPLLMHWQHPLAACLQVRRGELGLKAGLASYWLSRPVTVSTNWSIQIDQVSDGGDPNYFGNDRFWYRTSYADPRAARRSIISSSLRGSIPSVCSSDSARRVGSRIAAAMCFGSTTTHPRYIVYLIHHRKRCWTTSPSNEAKSRGKFFRHRPLQKRRCPNSQISRITGKNRCKKWN